MSRINWDYVFGVIMGAVVVKACDKLYKQGVQDGAKSAVQAFDLLTDTAKEAVESIDGEES